MTRTTHVISAPTMARLANIRKLVTELQAGPRTRDEIGAMLKVGPSGVRAYLADLGAMIINTYVAGEAAVSLVADAVTVDMYLAGLSAMRPARAVTLPKTPERIAATDPRRHFHILADDTHYTIKVSRAPAARDPMVAAFFGPAPVLMGAHA